MDLDIDDLLSEENRVPIKVIGSPAALAFVLGIEDEEDLPEENEVPYWILNCLRDAKVAHPDTPKQFGQKMQGRLKAQAWSVTLRELNYYYYECALKLSRMAYTTRTGGGNIGTTTFRRVLRKALASRYAEIMRQSLNSRGEDTSDFCDGRFFCAHYRESLLYDGI